MESTGIIRRDGRRTLLFHLLWRDVRGRISARRPAVVVILDWSREPRRAGLESAFANIIKAISEPTKIHKAASERRFKLAS